MPKAAAPSPGEWATVHDNFKSFDIDELNRVVRDYAFIELHAAARRQRWPLVVRVGASVPRWIGVLSIGGPLVSIGVFAGGGSEAYSQSFMIAWACIGSAIGCLAVLHFFVPWIMSRHRQWPRTMVGVSMLVAVQVAIVLVLIYRADVSPRWPIAVPVWLCLALSIGAIVSAFRYYSRTKPPAVDIDTLTADEIEVLKKSRRLALTTLRSRNIVAYKDFDEFDKAPL